MYVTVPSRRSLERRRRLTIVGAKIAAAQRAALAKFGQQFGDSRRVADSFVTQELEPKRVPVGNMHF
jgi:hypothetical protein